MGGYLNILIIVIGLGLVSLIGSFSNDVAIFTDIKHKMQGKSELDVIYDIVEEKTLVELEDKLINWQELLVKASQDVDLTEEEYEEKYKGLKKEEYELVYKVNRRLGVWDEDAMKKYEEDLIKYNNGEISTAPIFPKYYRIDDMGAKASMWGLAKQIVIKGEIFQNSLDLEEKDIGVEISKTPTTSYGQDYISDDFVEKDNLLNIKGLVDISGDLDKNKNLYTMTAVQLNEGKLRYYEYSLIEDKYEEEKTASIVIPDEESWKDAIPLVTTVYNDNTNLLESYIVIYSPFKKVFNMYKYSIIENEITRVLTNETLAIHHNYEKSRDKLSNIIDLDADQILYSSEVKDIKISSSFNSDMNIPHIIMGVNTEYLYGKENNYNNIKKGSIINYYDYFPIISNEFELSKLNHKGSNIKAEDWDISSFWSDSMNVGILKQIIKENGKLYSSKAMALLDDEFEDAEEITLPKVKLLSEKSNFKKEDKEDYKEIEIPQISEISLTSFSDKMSNLTKNILIVNYKGILCEFLGTEEIDEWEEGYEIDEIVNGSISVSSSRGDISRVQAIVKPKSEPFTVKDIDIEIEAFNQIDDIKTKGTSTYETKIYRDGLEYKLTKRKRN